MMREDCSEIRLALIEWANRMNQERINVNKSGNVSARVRNSEGVVGCLITPTGIPYESLQPEDIVFIPLAARQPDQFQGKRLASSEWLMHLKIYEQKPDVEAIVHTHSVYATALACQERGIPPFHYMVAVAGGKDIPCAPYATFGTETLADNALFVLKDRAGCLLAHHGVLATGKDLPSAFRLAVEIENLARCFSVVSTYGEPKLLSDQEMALNLEKFKTYGRQPK